MKHPIKEASQKHFSNQRLSDAQYEKFEALLLPVSAQDTPDRRESKQSKNTLNYGTRSWRLILALSASILCVLFIWRPNGLLTPSYQLAHEQQIERIAQEVAMNHIKMKPLEFTGNTVSSLRGQFSDLDFALVDSQHFLQTSMQGGRYCSIQGVTAAQLRFAHVDGASNTLYQVPFDHNTFGEMPQIHLGQAPIERTLKGLNIRMWVERNVLLVSVSTPALKP